MPPRSGSSSSAYRRSGAALLMPERPARLLHPVAQRVGEFGLTAIEPLRRHGHTDRHRLLAYPGQHRTYRTDALGLLLAVVGDAVGPNTLELLAQRRRSRDGV